MTRQSTAKYAKDAKGNQKIEPQRAQKSQGPQGKAKNGGRFCGVEIVAGGEE